MTRYAWSFFLLLGALVLGACGGDFDTVERGDMACASEPCELSFPATQYPRDSTRSVTVENTGNAVLQISDVYIEGPSEITFASSFLTRMAVDWGWTQVNPPQSFATRPDPLELQPQEQIQIELAYTPTQDAIDCDPDNCGTLVVVSNDRNSPTLEVPLSVDINAGEVVVTPTSIGFSTPVVGATQRERFSVRNEGTGPLEVESVVLTTDVPGLSVANVSGQLVPFTLESGGATDFEVVFAPQSTDPMTSSVQIATSDPRSPNVSVVLSTEGGGLPILEVSPTRITLDEVGVGAETEAIIGVTNVGEARMTWNVTLGTVDPTTARGDLSIVTMDGDPLTTGDPLSAGNGTSFKLVYVPSSDSAVQGDLRFNGNFGTEVAIPFSAGPAAPLVYVVPPEIFFGGVAQGDTEDQSFVVRNDGTANLDVSSMDFSSNVSGEFSFSPNDAPFTIGPGNSRQFTVQYSRPADDVDVRDQATITIASNATSDTNIALFAIHDAGVLPPSCFLQADPAEPYSVGQTITLDATGSEATAGELISSPFRWALVAPDGSTSELSADFGDTVTLVPDMTGTYTVNLTVSAFAEGSTVTNDCSRNLLVN